MNPTYSFPECEKIPACPVCGEPRCKDLAILGKTLTVPVMCRCAREKKRQEDQHREDEARREAIRRSMRECFGSRRDLPDLAQDDGHCPTMSEAARRYVDTWPKISREGRGLILYGPPGTGKTFFAAAITTELIRRYSCICKISSLPALLDYMQDRRDDEGRPLGIVDVIKSAVAPDLLIIDDLGAEAGTAWRYEKIFELIDARYVAQKSTIYTTNLQLSDLKSPRTVEQGRIFRRVLNDGKNLPIFLGSRPYSKS